MAVAGEHGRRWWPREDKEEEVTATSRERGRWRLEWREEERGGWKVAVALRRREKEVATAKVEERVKRRAQCRDMWWCGSRRLKIVVRSGG